MNLSNKSEKIKYSEFHYIFVEKIGPFDQTAMSAWQEVHKLFNTIEIDATKTGAMALFKIEPLMIYRAGFTCDKKPAHLPTGLQYLKYQGGEFAKYTLKGSYSHLPEAWGKVIELAQSEKLHVRDDFYIENYANDPEKTSEVELITELMIPTC
ncbi:MAG: GyrI-like domain-containing protein [Pseudobdellovibrio sp.]